MVVTDHAHARMREREISEPGLADLVETGDIRYSNERHLFIYKHLSGQHDNLVCAAASVEDALVIKTVMINWRLRDQP